MQRTGSSRIEKRKRSPWKPGWPCQPSVHFQSILRERKKMVEKKVGDGRKVPMASHHGRGMISRENGRQAGFGGRRGSSHLQCLERRKYWKPPGQHSKTLCCSTIYIYCLVDRNHDNPHFIRKYNHPLIINQPVKINTMLASGRRTSGLEVCLRDAQMQGRCRQ